MSGIPVGTFVNGEPEYWIPEDASSPYVSCPLCKEGVELGPGDADGFDAGYQWADGQGYVCPPCFDKLAKGEL